MNWSILLRQPPEYILFLSLLKIGHQLLRRIAWVLQLPQPGILFIFLRSCARSQLPRLSMPSGFQRFTSTATPRHSRVLLAGIQIPWLQHLSTVAGMPDSSTRA